MGLMIEFSPQDLGFPEYAEMSVLGIDLSEPIDYTFACDAFVNTFLSVSRSTVPVDTGFLRSTLDAYYDFSFNCTAITICEYAQYVEYGTWKQRAQPYFEPALQEALSAFTLEAQAAYSSAMAIVQWEAEMLMEEFQSKQEGQGGFGIGIGGGLGQIFVGIGLMILLFPIMLGLYGLLEPFRILAGERNDNSISGSVMPEVIIF